MTPVDDDLIERCAKKLHEGCPHCNGTGTVFEDYGGGHSVAEPCSSYEHAIQAADIVLRTAGRLTAPGTTVLWEGPTVPAEDPAKSWLPAMAARLPVPSGTHVVVTRQDQP